MVESSRNRDRDSGRSERGASSERGRERNSGRDSENHRGSSRYSYQPRDKASVDKRASMGANEFDKILKDNIKMWSPKKGDNRIRILPPTWPKPEHYGYDIHVHYGVGPDRGTYLDLDKMKNEADPITEERAELKRNLDANEDELKQMDSKRRVLIYLIDRDNESDGVQAWAMPWTVDKDISVLSVDKSNGQVLNIDDPEEGYDVEFVKEGEKERTKYVGISIARRASGLGSSKWLDFAIDNPLPEQLQFFTYDEIAKVFGGGGALREKGRGEESHAKDTDRGGRERESDQETRSSRDGVRGRGRGDSDRSVEKSEDLTWEEIHSMTADELDALVEEDDRLSEIKVDEAASDDELADWICEDLKIKKSEPQTSRRRAEPAEEDAHEKLRKMREERSSSRRR